MKSHCGVMADRLTHRAGVKVVFNLFLAFDFVTATMVCGRFEN